jgi:hypothetical protein
LTQLHETVHELELVRFLLARVDDDEAELKKLARQHSRGTGPSTLQGPRSLERLRAECTSKRQIIGALQQLFVLRDQPFEKQIRDAAAAMLQSLAMPYSGHAGYRKHWEAVAV